MSLPFILLVAVAVAVGAAGIVQERCRRGALVRARAALSEEELYERHYRSSGIPKDAILGAWRDVAECLAVDAGKLRPEDRLRALHTGAGLPQTDMDDLDVMIRVASRQSGVEPTAPLETVDEVVRFLAAASWSRRKE